MVDFKQTAMKIYRQSMENQIADSERKCVKYAGQEN